MRLKSLLLYSLLFSFSSLFGSYITIYDTCEVWNVGNVYSNVDIVPAVSYPDCIPFKGVVNDDYLVLNSYDVNGVCKYSVTPISQSSSLILNVEITANNFSCPVGESPDPSSDCSCVAPSPTCNLDTEYLNEINECVLLTSGIPLNFPDNNTSNGVTSIGSISTTEQGCADMERYNSSLGIVEVIGWDFGTQTCKVVAFKCNQGRVFDTSANSCIFPPDNTNFGSDSGCVNDNWSRRWTHDYCGECPAGVGVWLPPLGHEESGMECNKAYLEYQCVKDYRIKKYIEVSCGDPIPTDLETNEIDMDNLAPTVTVEQNLSNLPTIDPTDTTLTLVENLRAIETAINDNLNPKIDTVNENLKTIILSFSGVDDKLATSNAKLAYIHTDLGGIDSKIATSNTKLAYIHTDLEDIKGVLNTTGNGIDPSDMDIDITGLDGTNSIMDNLTDNVSELTDGITSIQTQFTETKALLSGEKPVINIGGGSCTDENLAKFAGYLAPYSSIFSLVVYVGFMISIFKMIFAYFARGE